MGYKKIKNLLDNTPNKPSKLEKNSPNNREKKVIFKVCTPFTDCISEINNTQVDNAKDIDIVMPMHNLIEYSNDYSETGVLKQYYRDKTV